MDLREKIADMIRHHCAARDANGNMHDINCGVDNCSVLILQIPEIKEALETQAAHRTGQVYSDAIAAIYPGTPPVSPASPLPKREA